MTPFEILLAKPQSIMEMADRLEELARNVDPNWNFAAAQIPDQLRQYTDDAFDRAYVDFFISKHEQRLNALDQCTSVDSNHQFAQFVPLWRTTLNRHVAEARNLQEGLADTASNLTLLLLIGNLCMSAASLMKVNSWWDKERRAGRF